MVKKKIIGICKYCGKEKALCRAHIIPKYFYKDFKKQKYLIVDASNLKKKQQAQNGAWDNSILCPNCDGYLNNFDKEGYRVLLQEINNYKKNMGDDYSIYSFNDEKYDFNKLRCFFISVLWRASISNLDAFKEINLGPYEDKALQVIKGENPHGNLFEILVFKEPSNLKFNNMVYVMKGRFENKISYTLFFSEFQVNIIPAINNSSGSFYNNFKNFFLNINEFTIVEHNEFYENKLNSLNLIVQHSRINK